jgi:hypothetical protein
MTTLKWDDRKFKDVIKMLESCTIYGRPVDIDNKAEVMMAAYYLGVLASEAGEEESPLPLEIQNPIWG